MTGLSRAAVARIKKSDVRRLSADATITLTTLLEEYGTFIAKELKKMSVHTGRKTVRGSDIR